MDLDPVLTSTGVFDDERFAHIVVHEAAHWSARKAGWFGEIDATLDAKLGGKTLAAMVSRFPEGNVGRNMFYRIEGEIEGPFGYAAEMFFFGRLTP